MTLVGGAVLQVQKHKWHLTSQKKDLTSFEYFLCHMEYLTSQ